MVFPASSNTYSLGKISWREWKKRMEKQMQKLLDIVKWWQVFQSKIFQNILRKVSPEFFFFKDKYKKIENLKATKSGKLWQKTWVMITDELALWRVRLSCHISQSNAFAAILLTDASNWKMTLPSFMRIILLPLPESLATRTKSGPWIPIKHSMLLTENHTMT